MQSWPFETWLAVVGLCIGTVLSLIGIAVNIWKPEVRRRLVTGRKTLAASAGDEDRPAPPPPPARSGREVIVQCPGSDWLALRYAPDFSRFETSILTRDYKALMNLKRSAFAKLGGLPGGLLYVLFLLLKVGTVLALCLWVIPVPGPSFLSVLALAVLAFGLWLSAYMFAAAQTYRLEASRDALCFVPGGGRRGDRRNRIDREAIAELGVARSRNGDTGHEAANANDGPEQAERGVPYLVTAGRRLPFDTLLDSPALMTPAEAEWLVGEIRTLWSGEADRPRQP